jgi:hypothetical protein
MYISYTDSDKVATFDMKLMDIDTEHLAIPVSIKPMFCCCGTNYND